MPRLASSAIRSLGALALSSLLAVLSPAASPKSQAPLPPSFQVRRLSPRAIDFFGGPGSVKLHTVVVASRRGLVVVDPNTSPRLAGEIKAAAAKELGRSDFRYVLLTHSHGDHAWGTAAFPGAEVVAHKNARRHLAEAAKNPGRALAEELTFSREKIAEWTKELRGLAPDSANAATYRTIIAREETLVRDYEAGFAIIPPTIAYEGRLTLDLGDLTAELIDYGPAHGDDDILIHFPEEKLLLTGDLAFDFSLGAPSDDAPARTGLRHPALAGGLGRGPLESSRPGLCRLFPPQGDRERGRSRPSPGLPGRDLGPGDDGARQGRDPRSGSGGFGAGRLFSRGHGLADALERGDLGW
jgi:glyoxylase-like metal-dependent hydrolase (beta-lactamase superfamily II)